MNKVDIISKSHDMIDTTPGGTNLDTVDNLFSKLSAGQKQNNDDIQTPVSPRDEFKAEISQTEDDKALTPQKYRKARLESGQKAYKGAHTRKSVPYGSPSKKVEYGQTFKSMLEAVRNNNGAQSQEYLYPDLAKPKLKAKTKSKLKSVIKTSDSTEQPTTPTKTTIKTNSTVRVITQTPPSAKKVKTSKK